MQNISYSQLSIHSRRGGSGSAMPRQSIRHQTSARCSAASLRASTGTTQQILFGGSLLDQAQQGTKPAKIWKQHSSACTKVCLCQ